VVQRREVHKHRFTALDRVIKRDAEEDEVADLPILSEPDSVEVRR
jgi:hypothetical protein